MDGVTLLLANRAQFIDRVADDVDHAAQGLAAHRNADRSTQINGLHATNHTVGRLHGHRADAALAEVLLHLKHDRDGFGRRKALAGDAQRLIDGRHRRFFKLHVYGRAGDLNHFADVLCHCPAFLCELQALGL